MAARRANLVLRSPVTLLCVAAAPCFSTIACAGSARDYLNAPIDSWLTTYNAIYSASVTPEDGTDISSLLVQTSSDSQLLSHGILGPHYEGIAHDRTAASDGRRTRRGRALG